MWGATRRGNGYGGCGGFQSTLPVWGATVGGSIPLGYKIISIHAPRVGSDNTYENLQIPNFRFQSTLPVWGATQTGRTPHPAAPISIHAPRVGSDVFSTNIASSAINFNPRSPCGERPLPRRSPAISQRFQSTLPVWGATIVAPVLIQYHTISIHAPRVGSDCRSGGPAFSRDISIHAPRVGSDCHFWLFPAARVVFQSTLPVWGATHDIPLLPVELCDFNPRSPCGERRLFLFGKLDVRDFNPRSPCGERPLKAFATAIAKGFQSTLPVWGATKPVFSMAETVEHFNPRSPCGERQDHRDAVPCPGDFNPRSPCGERLAITRSTATYKLFQSTLPVWGATGIPWTKTQSIFDFNPRSPCGERPIPTLFPAWLAIFQSTLPVWGATPPCLNPLAFPSISIHAPRVGSDGLTEAICAEVMISIHAPRVGSDALSVLTVWWSCLYFNPRSPCGERQKGSFVSSSSSSISIHAPRVGSDSEELQPQRRGHFDFNPRSPCGERLMSSM